jgi:hypothetical protein
MSQRTVSGVAPTTGITLSHKDVGENARSAADLLGSLMAEMATPRRAELDDMRLATRFASTADDARICRKAETCWDSQQVRYDAAGNTYWALAQKLTLRVISRICRTRATK